MWTPHRRSVAIAVALVTSLGTGLHSAGAQAASISPPRTWAEMRAAPGVDTTLVAWLEANVPRAELSTVLGHIGRLSQPSAVQLLPSLAYLEGSPSQRTVRAFIDSMSIRPPAGAAGAVRVAYLLARARYDFLRANRSTYLGEFGGRAFALPAPPAARVQPGAEVRLSLDFAPAETLLAIVGTPNLTYSEALRRISTPAFDALVSHHGQAFYPVPLTREQLAQNLVHAASDEPLDQLYMYARPSGFYHFGDMRQNAAKYREIFAELHRHQGDIAAYANASLAPFVPPGTQLDRRVSFYFNDLSDGWGSGTIAAVPIEYYKDDYLRMFNTMVHETFHAAQSTVQATSPRPARQLRTAADTALAQAARTLLIEGTANYIAPAVTRTPASADSMTRVGAELLAELAAMRRTTWDASRAQAILNQGVSSAGPFYWLGAAMSRRLVERGGAVAIGRAIASDGLGFARSYLDAAPAPEGQLVTAEVGAWVRELTGTRP